jgi:antitoxin HicB
MKKRTNEYHFRVHKEKDGFWAECIELEGLMTQGDSLEELRANMREALNLHLDEPADSTHVFPGPKPALSGKRGIEGVPVDPQVWFAMYLRQLRIKSHKSQREVARALNMKHVWSYQRLEKAKTANPTLETIHRLSLVLPQFDKAAALGV